MPNIKGIELLASWNEARQSGMTQIEHAASLGIPYNTYTSRLFRAKAESITRLPSHFVTESTAQKWNNNISLTGNALIFSDMETPYHDANFINKCIRLAKAWSISNLVLSGDFVHFANFSKWAGDFKQSPLRASQHDAIMELINRIPEKEREAEIAKLESIKILQPDENISSEMEIVRQTVKDLSDAFENIYYLMGNHEKRKLAKQDFGEDVSELLRFLGAGDKWHATPYYWMEVISNGQRWRIMHPLASGANTARDMAVQYHCNCAMGHSHRWAKQKDPSGDYYALQIGHAVDEKRLSYVMQRDAKRDGHSLGALIIRDGYPFLLSADTPFEFLSEIG